LNAARSLKIPKSIINDADVVYIVAEDINNREYLLSVAIFGKVLITFGVLWLVSYLAVRWLVIIGGGGRDMYGIWLFVPDRILEIVVLSIILVISGAMLYFVSMKMIGSDELN